MMFDIDPENPENPENDEEEPTNPGISAPRARVLVAEDDDALRELIVARMRREGFDVVEAGSGSEALDVLITNADEGRDAIDLIVMDQRMPGATGLEIVRMLRRAAWPVPVVLITAFPDWELLVEANRLDVALVPKPFRMDGLSDAAIAVLLEHARSATGWKSRAS